MRKVELTGIGISNVRSGTLRLVQRKGACQVPRRLLFWEPGGRRDRGFGFGVFDGDRTTGKLSSFLYARLTVTHSATAAGDTHYFFPFRAVDRAIAIACFCGLPAFISVLMLAEMVALDEPFFRGIYHCDIFHKRSYAVTM